MAQTSSHFIAKLLKSLQLFQAKIDQALQELDKQNQEQEKQDKPKGSSGRFFKWLTRMNEYLRNLCSGFRARLLAPMTSLPEMKRQSPLSASLLPVRRPNSSNVLSLEDVNESLKWAAIQVPDLLYVTHLFSSNHVFCSSLSELLAAAERLLWHHNEQPMTEANCWQKLPKLLKATHLLLQSTRIAIDWLQQMQSELLGQVKMAEMESLRLQRLSACQKLLKAKVDLTHDELEAMELQLSTCISDSVPLQNLADHAEENLNRAVEVNDNANETRNRIVAIETQILLQNDSHQHHQTKKPQSSSKSKSSKFRNESQTAKLERKGERKAKKAKKSKTKDVQNKEIMEDGQEQIEQIEQKTEAEEERDVVADEDEDEEENQKQQQQSIPPLEMSETPDLVQSKAAAVKSELTISKVCRDQISMARAKLRILNYIRNIAIEDVEVNCQLLPFVVHQTDVVQTGVDRLEGELEQKRQIYLHLQNALVFIGQETECATQAHGQVQLTGFTNALDKVSLTMTSFDTTTMTNLQVVPTDSKDNKDDKSSNTSNGGNTETAAAAVTTKPFGDSHNTTHKTHQSSASSSSTSVVYIKRRNNTHHSQSQLSHTSADSNRLS